MNLSKPSKAVKRINRILYILMIAMAVLVFYMLMRAVNLIFQVSR